MKANIKIVLASFVVTALIAGNAYAGAGCDLQGQRDKRAKAKEMVARELNLSADQQDRLKQQRTAHRETMETLRSALKEKKHEMQDALSRPDTTREQAEPILSQIKKLQSDMADKRMDGIFAVKGILSPEQFAKLQAMKEKKMQSVNKKRGRKEQNQ